MSTDEFRDEQVTCTTLYALIEAFHDVVARPRIWQDHYEDCRHYAELSLETGRAIYRWRINRILRSGDLPFELAEHGENVGHLVQRTDDARTHLIDAALASPDRSVAARVKHAVALFRIPLASRRFCPPPQR